MWKHKYGWLGSLEFVGSTENICELNLILLTNLASCSEVMAKAKKERLLLNEFDTINVHPSQVSSP